MNALIFAMGIPQSATFAKVLEELYTQRYCGSATIHFVHGVARKVDLPREPVRIALDVDKRSP